MAVEGVRVPVGGWVPHAVVGDHDGGAFGDESAVGEGRGAGCLVSEGDWVEGSMLVVRWVDCG